MCFRFVLIILGGEPYKLLINTASMVYKCANHSSFDILFNTIVALPIKVVSHLMKEIIAIISLLNN